ASSTTLLIRRRRTPPGDQFVRQGYARWDVAADGRLEVPDGVPDAGDDDRVVLDPDDHVRPAGQPQGVPDGGRDDDPAVVLDGGVVDVGHRSSSGYIVTFVSP